MQGFEPYIIIARKHIPWYDERFTGYNKNKISHLFHIASELFFLVHPRGFVVHFWHPPSPARSAFRKNGHFERVSHLFAYLPSINFSQHIFGFFLVHNIIRIPTHWLSSFHLQTQKLYYDIISDIEQKSYVPKSIFSCIDHDSGNPK